MLFYNIKDTHFESNSQLAEEQVLIDIGCSIISKILISKAIMSMFS